MENQKEHGKMENMEIQEGQGEQRGHGKTKEGVEKLGRAWKTRKNGKSGRAWKNHEEHGKKQGEYGNKHGNTTGTWKTGRSWKIRKNMENYGKHGKPGRAWKTRRNGKQGGDGKPG